MESTAWTIAVDIKYITSEECLSHEDMDKWKLTMHAQLIQMCLVVWRRRIHAMNATLKITPREG
jgi:hypothetical protein